MVLLVSIDGMRPDGLLQAETPNIDRLIHRGASTMNARTVMPSVTLPCHTSMLRGVDVARHGITTNTFHPLARPVPSVIDVAHGADLKCGFFCNWGELRDLADPDSIALLHFVRNSHEWIGDYKVAEAAVRYMQAETLDFAFVYFGHTDDAGHRHGWMSEPYVEAIGNADRCLGEVLQSAGDPTVFLMSDHGGHERSHGTDMPEDMTIPWIASGPGIRRGHTIQSEVRIYDTAPSVARALGVKPSPHWDGKAVEEAFEG
jgi:predicted AlkP superfamily pyrophosphatase or phosphodiesterase